MRYEDPDLRGRLAAEYVLGTMPARSRRRFERLIASDPALAGVVAAWADRLAPIDAMTSPEEPPARVWRAVEARIAAGAAPPAPTHSWLGSLALWRGLALAAGAAAAALIVYVVAFTGRIGPPIPTVVAVLADQSGDPSWIAIAGPRRGEVSVSAVRSQAEDTDHSFELWGIAGGTPHPLGLLRPQSGSIRIMCAAQLPQPGDLLAVSLEPPGGSPTGETTCRRLSRWRCRRADISEESGMNLKLVSTTAVIALAVGAGAMAAMDPMVGGAPMYPTKNIVQNAVNSKDHTTLVAAVKAAGLVQTLEGPGPFTVFAPTNEAFAALPAGTVDTLLKPENKPQLTQILTYHVVPGRYDATSLDHAIKATPGGRVSLKTAEGELLIAAESGNTLTITDQKGNTARVTIPDVYQSNGVILVIDKVLMP